MNCPKCNNANININIVNDKIKTNNTSILRSLGRAFLILCTCGLWCLVPKRKTNSKIKSSKMAICQSCGYSWKL